jgi:hypothetical protein
LRSIALRPDHKQTLFDLARAYGFEGDKKRAIEILERAVAVGYDDPARVESEPAFVKLRNDPRFQTAVANIRAQTPEAIVMLPPMRVAAALANVELRPFYLPNVAEGSQSLSFLRVEKVRPTSLAATAGVREGMEVTAIHGLQIRGLREEDLNELMTRTVKDEIVLKAREPHGSEKEIRIPLQKTGASSTTTNPSVAPSR